ncbi:ATP-binding protein [Hymenobacter weizhouensis]|uniref:ATP-binding protein n=1 Tax=Hymenobacter sp. YIM 151500-1 TaxID=2987689 RepID=UPI002227B8EE|nr:ATP-binding protein [Hymenobacter sp. YIM 151500-1]UYZ63588.1 ATP-binding protein [Hymenobacter sp. YIM 151500-1]
MKWILTLLLLLTGGPLLGQHRYWSANVDSLQRVLHQQSADTARLRTLVHLLDLVELTEVRGRHQVLPLLDELLRLNQRTPTLDAAGYQALRQGVALWVQGGTSLPAAMQTLHEAVRLFDQAGRPVPQLLVDLAPLYNQLRQTDERLAYFQRQLTQYRLRGATENAAACYLVLGGSYRHRGHYDRAISCYLRAADLFRPFHPRLYTSELMVAGTTYAEWGNARKALHYLEQALKLNDQFRIHGLQRFFTFQAVAKVYLQQHNVPAALRYAEQALQTARHDSLDRAQFTAYALVLKSLILLQAGQAEQVRPLLTRAQQLADSLHLSITARPGEFALDMAWARYHASRHRYAQAEAHWCRAYNAATAARLQMVRPKYLKELIRFYDAQGQAEQARRYARIYLDLADTLAASQGSNLLAQYESERVEQAQNNQIARLHQAQEVQALRLRQRNQLLGLALAAIVLVSGLGGLIFYQLQINRRTLAQLRQTQNQLVQSEKWAFVGEVSAGIAHELQNPLNFMKKFAEVSTTMVDGMHPSSGEAQAPGLGQEILQGLRQNLQEISQHGIRASAIIRNMLEHSRAGAGQRLPTDLNALAAEHVHLARQSWELQPGACLGVEVRTDLAPNLPWVPAVAPDLGRVLLNLLGNAFYAVCQRQQTAAEPGYVPRVELSTRALPGAVEVRVRDNGVGMPPEVRERVFQPFFTTKPLGEGTGLGLSLSYDIITKGHGGTLTVETEEGAGTEFIVTLPG